MRKILLAVLWVLTFFAASALAQEPVRLTTWDRGVVLQNDPNPVFQSGRINRFFHYVGRHTVGTFTDLGKDREWLAAFAIDSAAQTADIITTCRGLNHGFPEANPLFGHTRSCTQFAFGASLLHVTKWVSTHAMTHEFCQAAWYERYSGTEKQQSLWSRFGSPSSCKHAMWAGDITTPFHISNSINNVNGLR